MLTAAYVTAAFAAAYLLTGLLVGIAFVLGPIERREPASQGSYAFRALLLPGMALLWPFVLKRWQAPLDPRTEWRHGVVHGRAWVAVAVALLLVLAAALAQRNAQSREPGAIRIGLSGERSA